VAGCRATTATSEHQHHSSAVFCDQGRSVSAWPWSHTRPPDVTVWSYYCHLTVCFLSAPSDPTSYSVTYFRRYLDHCPPVYCLSSGLMLLAVLWCAREPAEGGSVCVERCRSSTHRTGRRDHITPVLRQLHWLPAPRRLEFSLWLQKRRHTSLPTFDSFSSLVVVLSTRLPTRHSLFHEHAALSATEALLLRNHAYGTVYLIICDIWLGVDSSGVIWNHIYFVADEKCAQSVNKLCQYS